MRLSNFLTGGHHPAIKRSSLPAAQSAATRMAAARIAAAPLSVALLAIALFSASCTKEASEPGQNEPAQKIVKVKFSLGASEKTVLSGLNINWEEGDAIRVFDFSGANRKFTASGAGASATFSGNVANVDNILLLYPYSSAASQNGENITTTLPTQQSPSDGTFDKDANISLCKMAPTAGTGTMMNVCSIIRLDFIAGSKDVRNIKVEAINGNFLSGKITTSMVDGIPTAAITGTVASSTAATYVEMSSSSAIASGSYFLCACPSVLSTGIRITLTFADSSTGSKEITESIDLARNRIISLGEINAAAFDNFQEEADDTAADVTSSYAASGVNFASLKGLGHPRLFMKARDFTQLKVKLETCANDDVVKLVHTKIMANAENYKTSTNRPTYTIVGKRLLTQCRLALQRIFTFAYAYKMTGDISYLNEVKGDIDAVCNFTNWNASQHFLDPSEMALAVAIAYDWLYYDLTLEERQLIHTALKNFEMTPFSTYGTTTTNNWNQVCNGGAIAAGIVLYEKEKALSAAIIDKAIASNITGANYTYNPSGNGIEGEGYWDYALVFQAVIIQALENAFNTSCGIAETPGLDITGSWRMYMSGATGPFNFSDSSDDTPGKDPSMLWLAARYQKPEYLVREHSLLKLADSYSTHRTMPLFIAGLAKYPLNSVGQTFPENKIWSANDKSPIVLYRDGWTYGSTDKFFGFKGNGAYNNHSHMDAGTFVYDAYGNRWACDTHMGSYNDYEQLMSGLFDRSQKSNRWDILCQSNYFHNTLSFLWNNGSVNKWHTTDQVVGSKGNLVETYNSDADGYGGKMDLSSFYSDATSSVYRTIKFKDGLFYVIDEISAKSTHDAPFEWRMLTKADITVESNYLTLDIKGTKMYLYCTTSGNVSSSPVFSQSTMVRPSSWTARSWDSVQGYSSFHVAMFSATVASGSTATFTTVISPVKPDENGNAVDNEVPNTDEPTDANW